MGTAWGGFKFSCLWGEMLCYLKLNMLMPFGPAVQKEKVDNWNYVWNGNAVLFELERQYNAIILSVVSPGHKPALTKSTWRSLIITAGWDLSFKSHRESICPLTSGWVTGSSKSLEERASVPFVRWWGLFLQRWFVRREEGVTRD